ncbi:hypothetical protein [Streptomyces sp. CAU 1734]|uniref:hypothetical protein n=1 Tax=Streptomyces sp. CAU 1734 TaxID=3140360 RepID=UPI003260FD4F
MPRPNTAQLAYGSATVVFSTLALLLLTGTTATAGVVAIGVASLALGLLVATSLPPARAAAPARASRSARDGRSAARPEPAGVGEGSRRG